MSAAVDPAALRVTRKRGHSYLLDGEKAQGVTTVIREGVPKPKLIDWAAREAAGYAVDHWAELADLGWTTGTDGYEATARLREHEHEMGVAEGRRLPIVALTANAMKGDVEACLAAGMDDYVPKPFTQEQLIRVIERRLRRPAGQNVPG